MSFLLVFFWEIAHPIVRKELYLLRGGSWCTKMNVCFKYGASVFLSSMRAVFEYSDYETVRTLNYLLNHFSVYEETESVWFFNFFSFLFSFVSVYADCCDFTLEGLLLLSNFSFFLLLTFSGIVYLIKLIFSWIPEFEWKPLVVYLHSGLLIPILLSFHLAHRLILKY